jgi:hypothetical protein
MSKYNPFSHYDEEMPPRPEPIIIESQGRQFTLAELINVLQELLHNRPELAMIPVFHAEFGGLARSAKVVVPSNQDKMVIDQ